MSRIQKYMSSKQASPVVTTPLKSSPSSRSTTTTSIFGRSVQPASNRSRTASPAISAVPKKVASPRPQRFVPSPLTTDARGAFLTPRNRRAIRELLLPVRGLINHVRGNNIKQQRKPKTSHFVVRLIDPDGECVYKDRMSVALPEVVYVQTILGALGFGQLGDAFKRQQIGVGELLAMNAEDLAMVDGITAAEAYRLWNALETRF